MQADIYVILIALIAVANLPDSAKDRLIDAVNDLKRHDALGINARISTVEVRNVRSTDV